jgi:hypothetical protein
VLRVAFKKPRAGSGHPWAVVTGRGGLRVEIDAAWPWVKPVYDRAKKTVWLGGARDGDAVFRVTEADGAVSVAPVDYLTALRLSGTTVLADWAEGTVELSPADFSPLAPRAERRLPRGATGTIKKRIFADYYQFYIFDAKNGDEALPEMTRANVARGYGVTRAAAFIGTRAHSNDHEVVLREASEPPKVPRCDRALVLTLEVASGRLCVAGLPDLGAPRIVLSVPPGRHDLYVFAFSLGVDRAPGRRGERYEIYVAPPREKEPRVLKGAKRLL